MDQGRGPEPGLADAEKASPTTIDFEALLLAMSAKMPIADFFSVTDPGNCGGVSQLVRSAGRGMVEGGDPEGNPASYAKSFSFAFAEFIKSAGICSITVSDWDNARNPMKDLFTDSARATAFENAMNSIAPSAFDGTNGVVSGAPPCDSAKVSFDNTWTTAPFTNGKFVCLP